MSANGPIYDFLRTLDVDQVVALYDTLCDYDSWEAKPHFCSHMMGEVEERRDEMMDSVL